MQDVVVSVRHQTAQLGAGLRGIIATTSFRNWRSTPLNLADIAGIGADWSGGKKILEPLEGLSGVVDCRAIFSESKGCNCHRVASRAHSESHYKRCEPGVGGLANVEHEVYEMSKDDTSPLNHKSQCLTEDGNLHFMVPRMLEFLWFLTVLQVGGPSYTVLDSGPIMDILRVSSRRHLRWGDT
ncbi:hypothetical protein B0H34DRAFT_677630 [Crassisporium funariophilum]|nr:hypothetical protein B0H34DRAFT_677630 [Crassisporium funariophilum]